MQYASLPFYVIPCGSSQTACEELLKSTKFCTRSSESDLEDLSLIAGRFDLQLTNLQLYHICSAHYQSLLVARTKTYCETCIGQAPAKIKYRGMMANLMIAFKSHKQRN